MGGIERFEDIEAWKAARELTRQIYSISKEGQFSRDYGLRDQIQKATTSIMALLNKRHLDYVYALLSLKDQKLYTR